MVRPVSKVIYSPLNAGLINKNGRSVANSNTVSVYVGENFAVQTQQWFNLVNLVRDQNSCGMVTTNFLPVRDMKRMQLTAGGYRLMTVPNAGGSSVISEVLSFELLGRCFCAKLKKTEMEVSYFPHGGSITDYVCEMFQETVAVSVTRAMKYSGNFSTEDAQHLLRKKLKGVIQSTRNSLDKWSKQILHVWSTSQHVTTVLAQAYADLDTEIKANTVVMVTTAANADYIFNNG